MRNEFGAHKINKTSVIRVLSYIKTDLREMPTQVFSKISLRWHNPSGDGICGEKVKRGKNRW